MKENKKKINRREMLKLAGIAGAGVIAAPMLNLGRFQLFADSTKTYSARAIDLVQSIYRDRYA